MKKKIILFGLAAMFALSFPATALADSNTGEWNNITVSVTCNA